MTDSLPPDRDPGLNPALKSRRDETHDTVHSTLPPVETTSVQRGDEGRGWPIVWLVVFVICVVIALYILL